MGITISWDNAEQTVIRWDFEQGWTWDDYREAALETNAMIESVGYTVGLLRNVNNSAPPQGGNVLSQWQRTLVQAPSNMGPLVMVDANTFLNMMSMVFSQVQNRKGKQLLTAPSLEEGRALLAEAMRSMASE